MLRVFGLGFHLYPGLAAKNLNERYTFGPGRPSFPEYAKAYQFASELESHLSLGVDLSENHWGWVFCYYDGGHGPGSESGYLCKSLVEFLTGVLSSSFQEIRLFAPMVSEKGSSDVPVG
jgi:hypothetical protein